MSEFHSDLWRRSRPENRGRPGATGGRAGIRRRAGKRAAIRTSSDGQWGYGPCAEPDQLEKPRMGSGRAEWCCSEATALMAAKKMRHHGVGA